MDDIKRLRKNIIAGNVAKAAKLCREMTDADVKPQVIIRDVLVPSMNELSMNYDSEKIYIPQLLLASKALNECIKILKKSVEIQEIAAKNTDIKIVIGTIKGDIHSIGKNIVSYLLQTYGYTVIDLGTNVSGEQFVKAIHEYDADCVIMSAMLTSTMIHLKNASDIINYEKFDKKPYILIGGALITEDFARECGVDYGFSAIDTAAKVQERFEKKE